LDPEAFTGDPYVVAAATEDGGASVKGRCLKPTLTEKGKEKKRRGKSIS